MLNAIREFLKLEAASGIVLFFAAVLAMLVANSPLAHYYNLFIDIPVVVRFGPLEIAKPLLLWINDGLMAVFFFLVGLELKREVLEGELSDRRQIALPAIAALGGMLVPALIYAAFNFHDPVSLNGWAIPAATDIAFALGILSLLGDRVPTALKVFLVSIAIFDDLGAIVIIALFYTSQLSLTALVVSLACLPLLYLLNRRGVTRFTPYLFIGLVMWVALLKSGVHATLAGVALALFIPLRSEKSPEFSPLRTLEHDLHATVAFGILPLFAFANSGIGLAGVGAEALLHPVALGVAMGLLFGKQIGVFVFSWLAIRLGMARLPEGAGWRSLYGVAVLCGIGFTMSLFIGSLAFQEGDAERIFAERIGIIGGSLLSGLIGYLVLRQVLPRRS
ncbi:Na+/H+ antiporter NhaA [Plasticicumulans acidivorans]|uniref:Na(+)/H(+) antiporter NhaA n=1 Tax=Plasticicumulans acidivorans TaxID=886464 RepID=A0A317MV49_9GAMM|nr:Na+/H+ antiporter NhaA [Plasticicumulans acidivorans]PWV61644.1 sodium/proton antiporter (NhaA family) [Plasticicumulans acidivorans]